MRTTGRRHFPLRRIAGALLLAAASFTLTPTLRAAPPTSTPDSPTTETPTADAPAATIDFQRDIRPLLAEHCFECHGPDEAQRQADLRLDLRQAAVADSRSSASQPAVIVPGEPEQSELYRRVSTPEASERMPPPEAGQALLPAEVERLRQWIAEGAQWNEHWAFVAPRQPVTPEVADADWPRSPLDRFVLERLEQSNLQPAPEADRAALIRRVTLDLTGLPPTPAEVDAFLADSSPQAYERVVDRLLASPAYGERMALEWLDAARFADSGGYQGDILRSMWPWRDWVIEAFNRNQPFDHFTIEQLAGDLLPASPQQPQPTQQQRIATGFNRNHRINDEDGIIPEEFRVEYVVDRVETTATVWLGLTLGCARCHSHKYDPISQTEFYEFFAFFNNIAEEGRGHGNSPPLLSLPETPHGSTSVMVMEELEQPRTTHLLIRGAYDRPAEAVSPGIPAVLPALPPNAPRNRLGLARWLVDPQHPLTARVTVNRFWQMLFGTGLVATPEDFGIRGERPSHPELLDFLALQFIDSGWDVKALLRAIVTSATYRQSTLGSPASWQRDPDNRLLSRGPRFRLAAELIRDQALAASGLLVREQGGPSVRPYQPAGLWKELASAHPGAAGFFRRTTKESNSAASVIRSSTSPIRQASALPTGGECSTAWPSSTGSSTSSAPTRRSPPASPSTSWPIGCNRPSPSWPTYRKNRKRCSTSTAPTSCGGAALPTTACSPAGSASEGCGLSNSSTVDGTSIAPSRPSSPANAATPIKPPPP